MRQRLALATALLGDPGILVLDELANGLDPAGMRWLRGFLRAYAHQGRTVLVSTHVLSEIQQITDQVIIISAGRLLFAARCPPLRPGGALPGGDRMKRLIHAELFKARSNRAVWILAAITPAFCALWALLSVSLMNLDSPVPLDQRVENVYNMAQQAYIFTFVLGVLGMTGEYRHQTITWSFLVTPVRGRVVTAKLVAYGLIGLLVAAGSTLVTFGAGAALLAAGGHPMTTPDLPAVLAGTTLSIALYAVFGVALGALIRNQVAAIVVAAVWFVFGDYLLLAPARARPMAAHGGGPRGRRHDPAER
ncbi:ABC transporter permease subunit [Streptosporangium lutulentum]